MKKSVILIIAIVYIGSIFAVGFLGTRISSYDVITYAKEIKILNPEVMPLTPTEKYIRINFKAYENEDSNPNIVYLSIKVEPENTTNSMVTFSTSANTTVASVNRYGVVIFNKKGAVTVYIKADDGSNIQNKILVIAV